MAQIAQYNETENIAPTDRGTSAMVTGARRIGANYSEAGEARSQEGRNLGSALETAGDVVVKYAEHRNVAALAENYADVNDKLTQAWNDTIKHANPNDPAVAQKFRDEVLTPTLDKFNEGAWTEKGVNFAEQQTEHLRNHFYLKTSADMASLAKKAVTAGITKTSNLLSSTAFSDPSSVPSMLANAPKVVGDIVHTSPNLDGGTANGIHKELGDTVKRNIVQAGVMGAIAKSNDPIKTAEEWTKKYPQYISGAAAEKLYTHAKSEERYLRAEEKANDAEVKRTNTAKFHAAANEFELSTTHTNPDTGQVEPFSPPNLREKLNQIATMPDADPGRVTALIHRAEQVGAATDETTQKHVARVSRTTQADFVTQRLNGGDVGPKDFDKAFSENKLTWEAKEQLKREYYADTSATGATIANDRKEFFTRFSSSLDPTVESTGTHSALGSQKIYAAEQDARRMEDDLRKRNQDPHSLYDHSSPNFFGRPENLQKYQISLKQATAYTAQAAQRPERPADVPQDAVYNDADKTWYVKRGDIWNRVKRK